MGRGVDAWIRPTNIKPAIATDRAKRNHLLTIHLDLSLAGTMSPAKRKSSSITKGIESARENGQPTIAAVANRVVTSSVRCGFLELDGSMLNADARVTKYIAKEDGRNADVQIC